MEREMLQMARLWSRWIDERAGLVRSPEHLRELARATRAAADAMDAAVDMALREVPITPVLVAS